MPIKVSDSGKKLNHFYIITNETKDVNFETTNMIKNYLHKRGKSCWVRPEAKGAEQSMCRQTLESEIPAEAECVIVLGGDGTLLRAARNLVNLGLPFLGINLGHLGYLTEGDRNSITGILERVIAEEYFMEERMMLRGRLKKKDGRVISDDVALNDITINRSRSLRVIKFKLYVNGEFLYLYTADGIIISTPTGSTAYNLSCGGPVVEPTAKLFVVTPISPHSLNNRSLILSSTDTIELELLGSDKDLDSQVEYVTYYDGDSIVQMEPGDRLEIVRAEQVTKILKLSTMSFLETLRIKMS
ncbi:NAD(+)/NADH kinase [Hominifimenecus sp. rT4P-3]|uniref:NAD(+)/NADH kinase n=1 Tax=Hominifimenecus sp. rT4P-3 TaxID=3242979 RepID=UPI003DA32745